MSTSPTMLDRYQLVEPIGKGGMALVFRARLLGLGGFERDVALKLLLPEHASEDEFIEMLLDEARIAGGLHHPCVVQVLDIGRQEDRFYLVMEYVDGSDLRTLRRKAPDGRLPAAAALFIVGEVLRGLHAVHTAVDAGGVPRNIIHRDVSPANVLVGRDGVVKLGDFGIAHASIRLSRTRPGAVKGKLRYMAPEQLRGRPVDARADLYAAGVLLCEMLTGDKAGEKRRKTPFGPVFGWAPEMAQGLDADLVALIERAMAEDPARRFPDAAAFRRALVQALTRRSPGYGAEELVHDLAALDEGFLSEAPTVVSEAIPLDTPPPLPATQRVPKIGAQRSWLPQARAGRAALAVGATALGALMTALLLAFGVSSSSVAAPLPPAPHVTQMTAPIAQPLVAPPALPVTGVLAVDGPAGAQVAIGATRLPAAPCRLELAPGAYDVKVRRSRRSHAVVRHVTIAAGATTSLRL